MTFEKTEPLNEFVTLQRGFDLPKGDRVQGDIPVIASTGINGYHFKAKVAAPGVVIGRSGSIGGGQYITEDFWPLNTTLWVKDFKGHYPRYVYYLFRSIDFKPFNVGGAVPTLNRNHLSSILVADIGYENEKNIAGIVGGLDDKITLNHQINKTLEAIVQCIFKSWFVDFDPVKAKMEALASGGSLEGAERAAMGVISSKSPEALSEFKQTNPNDYQQLAKSAALFPSKMQDSELGEIPEGWNVDDLGSHIDVLQTGSRPKGGVGGIKEGVPSVGAENINGVGNYAYGKEKFVSQKFFDKLKRGVIEDFDFLLYKDGGKPGEFKPRVSMFGCGFPYSEFAINEHVFRIRSKYLGQAFLYFLIGHERILGELANRGGKAAIPGINQTDVKTIPIIVPSSPEILSAFNGIALKVIEGILKQSNESNKLAGVRDALLPKLLSGEVDISTCKEETIGASA